MRMIGLCATTITGWASHYQPAIIFQRADGVLEYWRSSTSYINEEDAAQEASDKLTALVLQLKADMAKSFSLVSPKE